MLDWYEEWLVVPEGPLQGEPLEFTPEQAQFILDFYRLDPRSGRRVIRRGVLSRAKGWGKSPIVAAITLGEAIGPAVPDPTERSSRAGQWRLPRRSWFGRRWSCIRHP